MMRNMPPPLASNDLLGRLRPYSNVAEAFFVEIDFDAINAPVNIDTAQLMVAAIETHRVAFTPEILSLTVTGRHAVTLQDKNQLQIVWFVLSPGNAISMKPLWTTLKSERVFGDVLTVFELASC
jgi:hypothetical protein